MGSLADIEAKRRREAGCVTNRTQRLEKVEADNARLREVLSWYKDRLADINRRGVWGDDTRAILARDAGKRAREVLANNAEERGE